MNTYLLEKDAGSPTLPLGEGLNLKDTYITFRRPGKVSVLIMLIKKPVGMFLRKAGMKAEVLDLGPPLGALPWSPVVSE